MIGRAASQVPEWFDLRNYDAAAHFGLAEWLTAFQRRHALNLLVQYAAEGRLGNQDVASALEDPLWQAYMKAGATADLEASSLAADNPTALPAVVDLSLLALLEMSSAVRQRPRIDAYFREFRKALEKREVWESVKPHDILQLPVHMVVSPDKYWNDNFAFAEVDLAASDKTIVAAFEAWLSDIRATRGERHRTLRYSKKDCRNWFASGVLPYLDLFFWSTVTNTPISDRVISEAIFPLDREINVGEALRNSTRPLAENVLSGELVNSLRADLYGATTARVETNPVTQNDK